MGETSKVFTIVTQSFSDDSSGKNNNTRSDFKSHFIVNIIHVFDNATVEEFLNTRDIFSIYVWPILSGNNWSFLEKIKWTKSENKKEKQGKKHNSSNHQTYLVTSLSLRVALIIFDVIKLTVMIVLPVTSNTFTRNFCFKFSSNRFKKSEFFLISSSLSSSSSSTWYSNYWTEISEWNYSFLCWRGKK